VHEEVVHEGFVITLAVGTFEAPDGSTFIRDVVHHPGAVSVVPVHDDGTVSLVTQYRAAIDGDLLEIPAGRRDVPGEPPEQTAHRELQEEIGLRAGRLDLLVSSSTRPASPTSTPTCLGQDLTEARSTCRASRSST
jgi:ADP-ribose pyrophosphatase